MARLTSLDRTRPGPRVPPLTHHQTLTLVAPFVARGRHVDLTRSDRTEHRLAFVTTVPEAGPAIADDLRLACQRDGFQITRRLTDADGLEARLTVEGPELAPLAELILGASVPIAFTETAGVRIARNWTCWIESGMPTGWRLGGANAIVGPVAVELDASGRLPGIVDLILRPASRSRTEPDLPEDLVAVLGRAWRPLTKSDDVWRGSIRISRSDARRSSDALDRMETTVAHLARTFSSPPSMFHDRHGPTRTRVMLRRAIPLAACVAVPAAAVAAAWALSGIGFKGHPVLLAIPELMLVAGLLVSAREIPVVEIPPRPRPLSDDAWTGHAWAGDAWAGDAEPASADRRPEAAE